MTLYYLLFLYQEYMKFFFVDSGFVVDDFYNIHTGDLDLWI